MIELSRRALLGAAAAAPLGACATSGASAARGNFSALDGAMHALVDERKLAGVVTLVSQRGRILHEDAYGKRDLDANLACERDTIFRIASMTKPVTGVGMMMLWEEGKWGLDDPVARHIPEFANLVVATPTGHGPQIQPMNMRQLMSHTAGFDVSGGYTNLTDPALPLQAMIDKLAALPLPCQPGTDWRYGPVVNIQGYVIEKLSGMPLDRFFAERIFQPLGMVDTGFWVATEKLARLSKVHTYDARGAIVTAPRDGSRADDQRPVFLSGSGGLYSTTQDYWRFAQALLDGGVRGRTRILRPETVTLMRQNVLAPGVGVDLYGPVQQGVGFGLDFAVLLDPAAAGARQGRDTYYWGGAFGTWFWNDPTNDVIVVGMIQNLRGSIPGAGTPDVRTLSAQHVYDALAL